MSAPVQAPPKVNVKRYRYIRNAVFALLTACLVAAFALDIPRIEILEHTARNLYFHVPMWFVMMGAFVLAAYHAIRLLASGDLARDIRSYEAAKVGFLFGILGLLTGMVWARFTWYTGTGMWWNFDPKQTMSAVQLLIFAAYFVLRSGIEDDEKCARISGVYLLFAAAVMPFLLYVLPREMPSLHPGADGNPAFSDITHPTMRLVFYPSVIGFFGLFWVLYTQRVRLAFAKWRLKRREYASFSDTAAS